MTLLVEWKGRQVDVDPEEFTTRDLGLIESRAGLDYPHLVLGVLQGQGEAIRALFWLVDHREDPELKFGDYDGPPMKVWKQLVPHFAVLADDLGKATENVPGQAPATAGSDGSASSTPGADPTSSTD